MTYLNVNNPGLEALNAEFKKCVEQLGSELDTLNKVLNQKEEALFGSPLHIWEDNQQQWNKLYIEMLEDINKESGKSIDVHNIILEGDRKGQNIMLGNG